MRPSGCSSDASKSGSAIRAWTRSRFPAREAAVEPAEVAPATGALAGLGGEGGEERGGLLRGDVRGHDLVERAGVEPGGVAGGRQREEVRHRAHGTADFDLAAGGGVEDEVVDEAVDLGLPRHGDFSVVEVVVVTGAAGAWAVPIAGPRWSGSPHTTEPDAPVQPRRPVRPEPAGRSRPRPARLPASQGLPPVPRRTPPPPPPGRGRDPRRRPAPRPGPVAGRGGGGRDRPVSSPRGGAPGPPDARSRPPRTTGGPGARPPPDGCGRRTPARRPGGGGR